MKILVIGGGAREHALVWALRKNPRATEIVCAPGNAGISSLARCVEVDSGSCAALLQVIAGENPDLVVVGPEIPLAGGIVDALQERGIPVFGPTRAAAQLESSKGFAKQFMQRWGIPTAAYALCRSLAEVKAALTRLPAEVVVKADGLAAGKGVILCASHQEALRAAEDLFTGTLLGSAVQTVVLEETLTGPEISFFAICDGTRAVTLATAQDHKRLGEGDTGPNTGGMGAYTTDTLVAPEMEAWLLEHIAQRVVDGMKAEGVPFSGVLFTGLMMTPDGPKVLEFNTRFGDPETEAIMLRLDTDLLEILEAAVEQRLADFQIRLKPGASACVVAASAGYPGPYRAGKAIHGLETIAPGTEIFHAGTVLKEGMIQSSGGRVLAIAASAANLPEALNKVYRALNEIDFEGMQYRKDIGWRALGDC